MRSAFTLIEIIIVVVVIGILAAVAAPKFLGAQVDTELASTAEDLRAIENAVSMYFAKHGSYPRDVNRSQAVSVLAPYFKAENPFEKLAPIGGVYDYEGPPNWNPVQISIRSERRGSHSQETAIRLDEYMDNGDLNTGTIRRQGNRTYYIIGER
jgi:prepilin-type N-terminal cleavage/methylation domain-containing protein